MQDEPLASPVSVGEIVAGKYVVERVLGVGGMGVVVGARHTTLDQAVAIKFLVANRFGSQEEAIGRFLAEARAAARIESDHVCRVFDVGTLPSGVPFMVMEHLVGNDLDLEIERRGQLPLVEAVDYVMQAADALAAAHQLGIIHRDIKPGNLFLTTRPDGSRRVKVLDFGISKAMTERGHTVHPLEGREATSLGSPAYMSPEQVRASAEVDARADIWGLGAILYELVTGQMAFVGADVRQVLDMVMREDPCPMNALRRDVPPELEGIVMRCLARERDARWPTAATLARALVPWGSIGMFNQLPSVQRELGSLTSISGLRAHALPSVEPMVANVRPGMVTEPDLDEARARESIVQDWHDLRARKRTARSAMLVLGAATSIAAAVAVLLWMTSPSRRGATTAPPPAESGNVVVTATPVPVVPPPPAEPAASTATTPATAATAATPATAATASSASATAAASPAATSVQSAANSVHSARTAAPRPAPASRPASRPTRASGASSVNRLLDTRD